MVETEIDEYKIKTNQGKKQLTLKVSLKNNRVSMIVKNLDNPKLKFVKHEDYIPKEYLPTFNANTIELNFHRIKEFHQNITDYEDERYWKYYLKFVKSIPNKLYE